MPAPKPVNYEQESEALQSPMLNVGRSLAQKFFLVLVMKQKRWLGSAFDKSKTYDEFLEESRQGLEEIRQKAPAVAYGTEIAGGITTEIGWIRKNSVSKTWNSAQEQQQKERFTELVQLKEILQKELLAV